MPNYGLKFLSPKYYLSIVPNKYWGEKRKRAEGQRTLVTTKEEAREGQKRSPRHPGPSTVTLERKEGGREGQRLEERE